MKKTSVYLEDELDAALAQRAAEEGLSKAELIRRELTRSVEAPRRPLPSIGVIGASGPRSAVARDVDAHLAATGFGGTASPEER